MEQSIFWIGPVRLGGKSAEIPCQIPLSKTPHLPYRVINNQSLPFMGFIRYPPKSL